MQSFFQSDLLGQPIYVHYNGNADWSRGVIRAVYLSPSDMQLYLFISVSTGKGKGSIIRVPFDSQDISLEPLGSIVRLMSFPPEKRISVIKLIRSHCGLVFKDAKDATDHLPFDFCLNPINQPFCTDESNQFVDALESEGAVVEVLDGNETRTG